ncbi:hypothetical protein pdam_00007880 [Pocillopora damicornis]|uniref:Secreted protein n=1 Tax=Pocillopora damicornis TaxID=46731 RepID=A0A3M6T855_POCDA|nr:hypothetical protein pdam_00007880 [Pocillopora damicornis]
MCSSKVLLLRVSLAFISVYVESSSSQTSVAVVVFPTPEEPDKRAALKDDPYWSLLKKKAAQNKNIWWKFYPISQQENELCRCGTGSWRA